MSNKADRSGLVPSLRFPEFMDAGEWENKELRKVAAILNKKAGSNKYRLMSVTTGVGLVSQLEKFGREIAGAQYKNYLVIEKNDFAYNKSATKEYPEGFIGMYSGNEPGAVPNSIFTCFRVDASTVSPKYLDYLFIGNLHGKWLKKFLTVGARAHGSLNIDDNDLLALPVPFPQGDHSLIEQQKIADCLASLDELLTLEAQKLDTLKTNKKGLMQQLFPAEGETLPKLRFPGFLHAGEWEEKRLQDITSFIFDGTHQTPTYTQEGIPFYSVENLISGNKNKFISREDYLVATGKNKPSQGDILLTRIGKIGYSQVVTWGHEFSVYVTLAVIKKSALFDSHYLHYFMRSERYQTEIHKKSLLNAVPCKINMDSLRNTNVLLPKPAEQQKIADCLASLDDLVTAQTQKLAALKTHKKGLMQQLFPVLDEVSA